MDNLKLIDPKKAADAIELIGKEWMLIGAADGEGANAMTASWGAIGNLWNKPVCICYIRPQRYTFGLAEAQERMSISFFGDACRDALAICGRASGRDGDKLADAGLKYSMIDGVPVFDDARMTLICRKLYADWLREEAFIDTDILNAAYPERDLHKYYVCEIEKCLIK